MRGRSTALISLWLILVFTGLACSLTSNPAAQGEPTPTRSRRYVVLPSGPPTPVPGLADLSLPEQSAPLPATSIAPLPPTRRPRPTATPTPDNFAKLFAEVVRLFNEPTATPADAPRLVLLPTILPTPTNTATPLPTVTPFPTETPFPIDTPTLIPTPLPAVLPAPTFPQASASVPIEAPPPAPVVEESTFTSPIAPQAALPTPAVVAATFSSPVDPPGQALAPTGAAAAPATSGYDFMLAEFYNSPTTNSFIVIYVAIVDLNEIPIGDMKVVGTRLDHNLTYDSPLSTWHFEGYNAPGEVIKSGNVKFEPPGGIETTNWVLHLEDNNGKRLSEDVPFDTNQNDKQWYFIKFKRKF
jgi:hypothetical protein